MIWKQSDINNDGGRSSNSDEISDKGQQIESEVNEENRQDIDFVYDDTDEYTAEIAELYSYTEDEEFFDNKRIFYEDFNKYGNTKWIEINDSERKSHINRLSGMFDSGIAEVRRRAAKSLLYIFQGVFGECELEEDQVTWTRHNVFLSLECGILSVLVDLLLFEIKYDFKNKKEWSSSSGGMNESKLNANSNDGNCRGVSNKAQPSSIGSSLTSTFDLRTVLNMLYIVVETVRSYKTKHLVKNHGDNDSKIGHCMKLSNNLIEELNDSISSLGSVEDAPNLMIVLFGMIHRFCSGLAPNFPMKKVLLLLWKIALLIMGPVTSLFEMKNAKRASLGLPPLLEDSQKIIRYMKASNLPSSPADLLEAAVAQQQQQQLNGGGGGIGLGGRASRAGRLTGSNQGPKQGSLAGGRSKLLASSNDENDDLAAQRSFRHSLMLDGVGSNLGSNGNSSNSINAALNSTSNDSDSSIDSLSDASVSSTDTMKLNNANDEERSNLKDEDDDDDEEDEDDEESVLRLVDSAVQDDDSLFDVDEDTMDNIPSAAKSASSNSNNDPANELLSGADSMYNETSQSDPNSMYESGCATPRPRSPTNTNSMGVANTNNNIINSSTGNISLNSADNSLHLLHDYKTLPWKPKVKSKDLELFMETVRAKFIGYPISGQDSVTLAGLPMPIQDAVHVLKNHLYLSIGEIQIKNENDIIQFPLSIGCNEKIENTPAENLYRNMLPMIPQYMIALLKILLAAAPTSKSKTESINILAEVVPDEIPTTISQSMKLNYDVNRHKEIIVKAISGLLLLLLKHFKLNHIYQFEYVSQHLVFANCIPLVLKFFNQNTLNYVQAKNSLTQLDFPSCVIGEGVEISSESLEVNDQSSYCWRNLFSCINLLRILNMLTKWKHSRTMMMVVFKSPPILKRALKVRQAMLQLYVLKLLKSQTRYSGRQWRKTNMHIMSAIYQKVRHRLTDDWAYGNDVDARPWDFQAEECSLRTSVNRFNNRRYQGDVLESDLILHQKQQTSPITGVNCSNDVLQSTKSGIYTFSRGAELRKCGSYDVVLSQEFRDNYERWLQQEVYSSVPINWDQVLQTH